MMERKLTILYGSQSGTAQDLAEQIWRESKMYFFRGNVLPMDEYDVSELIGERFVVCVCSTYGQGEEPDNMKRFWKFLLRKSLPNDSLQQVHFAVLGLGDSRYPKFNYVAKKLHKRLLQLGGSALLPVGLCDDQHDLGYGAVFLPWINQLWDELGQMPVPSILQKPLPLAAIAEQYWDLTAIPRARAFAVLAKNCSNELEREKLIEFSRYEGQEELFAYANRPRRTILEVLLDFPHATKSLTLEALFELFQPIKPRAFSIASAMESGKLQILVAVIEYKTKLSVPRRGLCSHWLKDLQPGNMVNAWVRKSTFQLPADNKTPLVMIGPGTGLAPFRGILQERELSETPTSAPLVLFFGCRSSTADFHCEEDLKRMEQSGMLQLFCAFSRDQPEKVYVQHLIKKEGMLLKKLLIENGGYVLVSGSSKNMPQAVKEALIEAIGDAQHIEKMIQTNRYQEETWA
ncbi:AGAP003889-PB [Anopheles gambiae str. PEST]|uniref:AGAP003889-PB n=1 Tax=Anopheles gambiae TaxID=7165 RepID=F5HIW8_ANOGA|nr:AGAP003889-PB [Anopheles gambiae str. PEST]